MTALINTLIDKLDTYEIVRDKVALILAEESANQQQLATDEGKDPALWKLRVYIERTNPWEFLRTNDGKAPGDRSPVVCVWFDNSNMDARASQTIDRQQMDVTINIDVYGIGVTELLAGGAGHKPGDENAALEVQRGARLVRNILMADSYVVLGFPRALGLVGQRQISTIQSFQPEFGNQNAQQLAGLRLSLQVKTSELAPQTEAVILEEINAIVRDEDGQILIDATFESTP
jgi:hypothetical protein